MLSSASWKISIGARRALVSTRVSAP